MDDEPWAGVCWPQQGLGGEGAAGKGRLRAAGHRQLSQHRRAPVAAEASRALRARSLEMLKVTGGQGRIA